VEDYVQLEVLDTDVLVIGAGGAALRAAIASREENARVLIVSKGGFPSGCTPRAMGAMQVLYLPEDSYDHYLRDTVVGGHYMNDQELVKKVIDHSQEAAQDLERFGTSFIRENGKYKLCSFGGYTFPRAIVASEPYVGGFVKGLVSRVRELDIEVIDKTMITRLLNCSGAVVGAIGFDLETGVFQVFKAKSTILATGGAGSLYSLTTNPADVTGDGYVLAYDVSAELTDMEFIQNRPCIVHPATLRGTPPPADGLAAVGGRFYNARGERYMKKYDAVKVEQVTRDRVAICTYKEIREGRGTGNNGVYNDLSGVPRSELNRFESFLNGCREVSIDPSWQPIEWAPGVHYFMGGIKINESAETTVRGLFACGEVTAGVHGSNRIAGNSLTDVLVFGSIAGKSAAKLALACSSPPISQDEVHSEMRRILHFYKRERGVDFRNVRTRLQNIMDDYVGVVRMESGLNTAVDELEKLDKQSQRLFISGHKDYRELAKLVETLNLIKVGEMVTRASLERTESRGAHYREDFPKEDNERWLKNIVIRYEHNAMKLTTRAVRELHMKLPS
jgi:fumarate reductase (CoM/CoB) subunit A